MRYLVKSASVFALLLLISGCGSADKEKAEAAVKTSLEKWKAGGTPQQLSDQSISIADPDWKAGMKLLDFQIKIAAVLPQQGPRIVVVLNLQNRAGKKMNKEVAYEVLIKDKDISIGRDAFHVGP